MAAATKQQVESAQVAEEVISQAEKSDFERIQDALAQISPGGLHECAERIEAIARRIQEGEPEPRLSLDKSHGEFKRLVKWLLDRTPTEKLVGVAFSTLLNCDVEGSIKERKLYDGDVGDDVDRDYDDAVCRMVGKGTGDSEFDAIAAYLVGLSAAR